MNETALQMAEAEGTATAKQKLSVLQEQEELIADEIEQEEAQEAIKRAKEEQQKEAREAHELHPSTLNVSAEEMSMSAEQMARLEMFVLTDREKNQLKRILLKSK